MGRPCANQGSVLPQWIVLLAVALSLSTRAVLAGPENPEVKSGSAQFTQTGNYTTIQVSDNAIINYSSFDIAQPETVEFIQPSSNSSVLNRIFSANPTMIDGTLLANGRVFFVNPAGVIFGEHAQVDATQLIASALGISNEDFLGGNLLFAGGEGSVVNQGSIQGDSVYLIGRQVVNLGQIDCPGGYVVMAAGGRVFLSETGSNLRVEIQAPPTPPAGFEPIAGAAIENGGAVNAPGGKIVLAAAGDIYSQAISNVGRLSAPSTGEKASAVTLDAGASSAAVNAGTIDVSGTSAEAQDGAIRVQAGGSVSSGDLTAGTGTIEIQAGMADGGSQNAVGSLTGTGGVSLVGGAGDDSFTLAAPQQAYSLDGGAGTDKLTLLGTDGDDSIRLDAATGFTAAQGAVNPHGVESYEVKAGDGDDTLTVDFGGGNPIPVDGLVYDGQGQATEKGDALVVRGGSFQTVAMTFSGPKSGEIIYDDTIRIAYMDLEPIEDTTTAVNLTVLGPTAGDDIITVANGTGVDPTVTSFTEISFAGAAESYTFANKTNVAIDALGGGDIVTVNNSNAADGLASVRIDLGAGDDSLTLEATGGVAYTLIGNMGTDTLVGSGAANAWSVAGADVGALNGAGFTGFEGLVGGTEVDTFTLSGGAFSGVIDGAAGADTVDYAALAGATVILGADVKNVEELIGKGAGFTLANGSAWSIDGVNSGTVDGITFTNWANATGTSGSDSFTFAQAGSQAGTIDGAGGEDTLKGDDDGNVFGIMGADSGTLADKTSGWSNIEKLVGGTDTDAFNFDAGVTWGGTIDGGAGTDTLNFGSLASAQTVTLTGTGGTDGFNGTVGAVAGGFSNIDSLTGTGGNDTLKGLNWASTWDLDGANAGTYTSTNTLSFVSFENLSGGTGADTLRGNDVANTWTLTGADSGTVTQLGVGFSNMEDLVGGTDTDAFNFDAGVTWGGTIDGGVGTDTLNFGSLASAQTVTLTGTGGTDGFNGTVGAVAGGFSNIDSLTGTGGNDTLKGLNWASTWDLDGANAGTYTSTNTLSFVSFENLSGGTGADTLRGNDVANTWTLTGADSGTVTQLGVGFSNMEDLVGGTGTDSFTLSIGTLSGRIDGGAGTDTLTGGDGANTWTLTGATGGTVTRVGGGFSNVERLVGGTNTDIFNFNAGVMWGDTIDGRAGIDTLNFSSLASPQTVTLTAAGGTDGFNGTVGAIANGFSNIDSLIGTGGHDTLSGLNGAGAWNIDSANAGTYASMNSLTFTSFEHLRGNAAVDTFTFANAGSLTGTIDGAGGEDTLRGDDDGNVFGITGVNSGTLAGKTSGWSNVEKLVGGTDTDAFNFSADVTWGGTIDGGAGTDTLNFGSLASAQTVTLTATGGTDGFNGTVGAVAGGFSNIDSLTGTGANDTLIGLNAGSTWDVTGVNAGTYTSTNSLTFTSVENLTGGVGADMFAVAGAGSLTGAIDGADGEDTLRGDDGGNMFGITGVNSGTLAGKTSGWSNVENLTGGAGTDTFTLNDGTLSGAIDGGTGTDTLTGDNVANIWTVTGANRGTVTRVGVGFSNMESLVGGTSTDAFNFDSGVTWTGPLTIEGKDGTDVINVPNGLTIGDALTATAETINLGGTIGSGSTQTYHGAVVLGADAGLTGTGVSFDGTVDGAHDLTLAVSGATTFAGAVGASTPLGDGTGAGASLTINSTGSTVFAQPVQTKQGITQADGAGEVTFSENVTVLGASTPTEFNGNVVLDGMTFTSAGPVTFGNTNSDQVKLSGGPVTVDTSAANQPVTFNSRIDGGQTLRVDSRSGLTGGGAVTFGAAVGAETPIAGLTVDALSAAFGEAVRLGSQGLTLTATDTVNLSSAVDAGGQVRLDAAGDIISNGVNSTTGNIEMRSTGGNLIVNGPVNANWGGGPNGGGVSLTSAGGIYTGTSGSPLNVAITGYSDHNRSLGVDLGKKPAGYPLPPKAAIVIDSDEPLVLGNNAVLQANGVYYSDGLQPYDDREPLDLEFTGPNAGNPLDVAIYLRSRSSSQEGLPYNDVTQKQDYAGDITINSRGIHVTRDGGIGTLVVDAYDTVEFGDVFDRGYLQTPASTLRRIETVSRISKTLDEAAIWKTLPYASDPSAVVGRWTNIQGGDFYANYLLRGPAGAVAWAEELGRAINAPLPPPVSVEMEGVSPPRLADPQLDVEKRFGKGFLRVHLPGADPNTVVCDLLSGLAVRILDIDKTLRAGAAAALAALEARNTRLAEPTPENIETIDKLLREDPILADWIVAALDFVSTAHVTMGHPLDYSTAVFMRTYVPLGDEWLRAYLAAKVGVGS